MQWRSFAEYPSLRSIYASVFILEQSRSPITMHPSIVIPYVSASDIDQTIESFEHTINFWYPTVSLSLLKEARILVLAGRVGENTTSLIAFLIMALGCASQASSGLVDETELTKDEMDYRKSRKTLADMYMDGVLKNLHLVHMEISATAVQCLFLTA